MAGIEHGNVNNEEFMEEVARYECVYNRNRKNYKTKQTKKANSWEKIGEIFNLSCLCKYFWNPKPTFPSVLKLTLSFL